MVQPKTGEKKEFDITIDLEAVIAYVRKDSEVCSKNELFNMTKTDMPVPST